MQAAAVGDLVGLRAALAARSVGIGERHLRYPSECWYFGGRYQRKYQQYFCMLPDNVEYDSSFFCIFTGESIRFLDGRT